MMLMSVLYKFCDNLNAGCDSNMFSVAWLETSVCEDNQNLGVAGATIDSIMPGKVRI